MSSRAVLAVGLAAALGGCFDERDAAIYNPASGAEPGAYGPTDPAWPPQSDLSTAFALPPWLTLPGDGSVSVGWKSAQPSTGWVEVVASPDGALAVDWPAARRVDSAATAELHHVRLHDLAPATAYRYRVHIDDGGEGGVREGVFVTPGAARWRFVHLAEFHAPSDSDVVAGFGPTIRDFRPHVLVESGDMIDDGDDEAQWADYLWTSAPWISNAFLLPAHSNHVNGLGGNYFLLDYFDLPHNERWYTTRYGQVELVTLDSTFGRDPAIDTEAAWIDARMAESLAEDAPPSRVIAAWHYPACSSHYASRTGSRRWVIDHLVAALADVAPLDLVLVGHDKYYERSLLDVGGRTITHVMTNVGKLAPSTEGDNEPECTPLVTDTGRRSLGLYEIDADVLRARVLDEDGGELDRFELGP